MDSVKENITCTIMMYGETSMAATWNNSSYSRVKQANSMGNFMSPALFLFEVLKMVKLTRGPLVLYQLPVLKQETSDKK